MYVCELVKCEAIKLTSRQNKFATSALPSNFNTFQDGLSGDLFVFLLNELKNCHQLSQVNTITPSVLSVVIPNFGCMYHFALSR